MKIRNSNIRNGITSALLLATAAYTFGVEATAQTTPASAAPTNAAMAVAEPQLLTAVLRATGYESRSVHVLVGRYQIVVTLVNSALSTPMTRQVEALKIATALSNPIVASPEFKSVQAFHIDYVAETPDHAGTHLVDAFDFRRDPSGNFVFHKS